MATATTGKYSVKVSWSIIKPTGTEGNEGYTFYKDMDYEDVVALESAMLDTLKALGMAKLEEKKTK